MGSYDQEQEGSRWPYAILDQGDQYFLDIQKERQGNGTYHARRTTCTRMGIGGK